jgi:hypothetical protein
MVLGKWAKRVEVGRYPSSGSRWNLVYLPRLWLRLRTEIEVGACRGCVYGTVDTVDWGPDLVLVTSTSFVFSLLVSSLLFLHIDGGGQRGRWRLVDMRWLSWQSAFEHVFGPMTGDGFRCIPL